MRKSPRSRTLADDLSRSPFRPPPEVPAELAREEQEILARVRRLERMGGGRAEEYAALLTGLENVWAASAPFPPPPRQIYADLRQKPESASLAAVRRLAHVESTGRRVVLVEYVLTGNEAVLIVARDDWAEPKVNTIQLNIPELTTWAGANLAEDVSGIFSSPEKRRQFQETCGPLIEPLGIWSRPDDMICFVPHGVLHLLPLHAIALDSSGRSAPLIERNPIAYAPSAASLAYCRARRSPIHSPHVCRAAVFGNPRSDLPFAEMEARAVARSFGVEPLVGASDSGSVP